MSGTIGRKPRRAGDRGFTLIEVMVASVVLLLVFFGAAHYSAKSRSQMQLEEDRRTADDVARARLESIRRGENFESLVTLTSRDTSYVVDGRTYSVSHTVQTDVPETNAATVAVTVSWNAHIAGIPVARSLTLTSILGRCIPWDDTGGS